MSTPDPPTVWSRIYDDVKIQIPGVTDAVFKQMLFQVVNDFFDQTNIWVETVPITVEPSQLTYPFLLQNKGVSNRLMLLYDPEQGPTPHWVQNNVQMNRPGVIEISYAPSSEAVWNAVVAKCLRGTPPDSDGYPDLDIIDQWIISKYGDGLHYGVLGRLQGMPAKPYTNAKMSKDNWQNYVTQRSKARTDVIKSSVYGGQRWMYPQSFRTISRKGWV